MRLRRQLERMEQQPGPRPPAPQQQSPFPGLTPEQELPQDNDGFPAGVDPNDYLRKSEFERQKSELLRRLEDQGFRLEKKLDQTETELSRLGELREKLSEVVTDDELRSSLRTHAVETVSEAVRRSQNESTSFREALRSELRSTAASVVESRLAERLPRTAAAIQERQESGSPISIGWIVAAVLGAAGVPAIFTGLISSRINKRLEGLEDKNKNNIPDVLEQLKTFELLSGLRERVRGEKTGAAD